MELVLDSLSIWLLAFILILTLVHLVLLRAPEPATHPLLLGRQSELNKVRKPNESPAFISATAGLGGQAKQLFRNVKSVQDLWSGKGSQLALGNIAREASLEGKLAAVQDILKADESKRPFIIRIDDAADAFVATMAAAAQHREAPILLSSSSSIAQHAKSPLVTSTQEMQALRGTQAATAGGSMYLVDSGIALKTNPDKWTPEGWNTQRIVLEDLVGESPSGDSGDKADSLSLPFTTSIVTAIGQEHSVTVNHKTIVDGGVVSILSMFPQHERPKQGDRILSFENVLAPYGQSIAIAGAAVGATLRLCSPSKGITSKCRTFAPDIIFCTPNELNAFRAALLNVLPKESLLVPLALSRKRALLKSGNVSKTTFWDKVMFSKVRSAAVGDRLRCIVCSAEEGAGPSNEVIEYLRLTLGVPIIVALTHPFVAGPIANTMYSDFQKFTTGGEISQVGAPSATMECKLVNVDEEAAKNGSYRGELVVKGPSVAAVVEPMGSAVKTHDGWIRTGITAELQTNGTLRCIKALKAT